MKEPDKKPGPPETLEEFCRQEGIKPIRTIPQGCGRTGGDCGGDARFHSPNGLRMPHSAIPTGQGKLSVFLKNFFRSLSGKESSESMRDPSTPIEPEIQPMTESLESELSQSPMSLIGFLFGGGRIVK